MNNPNNSGWLWAVLVLIILAVAVYLVWGSGPSTSSGQATTTTPAVQLQSLTTPGGVSMQYDPSIWGLATTPSQMSVQSNIPSCFQGFDYCFYLNTNAYASTTFESAGLALTERTDLKSGNACLHTEPTGYSGLTPQLNSGTGYELAAFAPLGTAAAGSFSRGAVYRLYFGTTCYEFEAQLGQSQFANYPSGTIQPFTAADVAAVASDIQSLLSTVTIASTSQPIAFPSLSLSGS